MEEVRDGYGERRGDDHLHDLVETELEVGHDSYPTCFMTSWVQRAL